MNRIDELVASYNMTEREQAARLRELFDLLKQRSGYRHIKFDGALMLSNCWDLKDSRLEDETYLNKYNREIIEVVSGQE